LTEGIIPYLTVDETAALAQDLRALPVQSWILEYFSPESMRYRKLSPIARHMRAAPFKFEPDDWFGFFERHGWMPREVRYLADEGDRLGRPIPLSKGTLFLAKLRSLLVSQGRRDALRRFAGYAMLEPKN
jgi:O-methyltransferase involved in polyketide biosynthesis